MKATLLFTVIFFLFSTSALSATTLVDTRAGVDPPAFAVIASSFDDISLDIFAADDFTIPDSGWELTTIRAFGNYSNQISPDNAGPANSVNIYILPKTGTLPTSTAPASIAYWYGENLMYTELDLAYGGDLAIDLLPGVILPAGDYWLLVQPNMSFLTSGQWNWTESSLAPNSGTTYGDESAWSQSMAGVTSPITGNPECVGLWGRRVTDCSMTRNPDTNPPADRDFAFQLEGNILTPGVTITPTTLSTRENGANVSYTIVLTAPPSFGETVEVTATSQDTTEGTVSPSAVFFTGANWDVPQQVTITPGSGSDGHDGDITYSVTNAVSSDTAGGGYQAITAQSVSVTNHDIQTASIGDLIWQDYNGDGIQDAGEPGLGGIVVFLDTNSNTIRDSGEPSATTDASGVYTFTGLFAGTYSVRVDPSSVSGALTPTTALVANITLSIDENYSDADFGYRKKTFPWLDLLPSLSSPKRLIK